jgi:predicted Zn-dependent protease
MGKEPPEMLSRKRKRFTLMPAVALLGLSALVTVPMLSSSHLYAAAPIRTMTVTVHPGDTLWTLASRHTADGGDVQDTIDRITGANHLSGAIIYPGEKLQIPE